MCNTQKKILVHKQELKSTNKIFNTQFEVYVHINTFQCTINSVNTQQHISQHLNKFRAKREQENSIRKYILFSIHNKMLHLRTLGIM